MWVRKGECNGCGFCCEIITQVHLDFVLNDPDWIKVRGLPPNGRKLYLINDPCPQLEQETKRCKIYENRPQLCKDFPQEPDDITNSPCSYYFENTETGEIVTGSNQGV
jgi:Fe-S-cluster containining protein